MEVYYSEVEITRFSRPGSGLPPIDSHVLRPMITVFPAAPCVVIYLKCLRSCLSCQGSRLWRPIPPLGVTAITMLNLGMFASKIII